VAHFPSCSPVVVVVVVAHVFEQRDAGSVTLAGLARRRLRVRFHILVCPRNFVAMEDDVAGLLSDEEDDGPQHDPGHGALVVAQPPAEVPARTSTLQVRATAVGRAAPTVLSGNPRKAVWSLYKNVMSSVFDEVRQLVEQEGLEPSVATDIREVRLPQRILASAQPHSAPRNCRGRNGRCA
jgi:hypothetical protein